MTQFSEKRKGQVVGFVVVLFAAANLVPLHYSSQGQCPDGGTFTQTGITMGLPLAYYQTQHSGMGDCNGVVSDSPARNTSAQAFITDGLVFGVVAVGINLLLDRRTKA
jgi:hypothetical protein